MYVLRDKSRHVRFILSPPKRFCKKLIVSTSLRHHLKIMSEAKSVPKGLKDQEVERGSIKKHLPIPYVPVVDKVQDVLNKSKGKESTYTIKLLHKTEFTVNVWDAGTPEASAVSACKRKGLFLDYATVTKEAQVASEAVTVFCEVIANTKTPAGKAEKGAEPYPPEDAKESLKGALTKLAVARKAMKRPQKDSYHSTRISYLKTPGTTGTRLFLPSVIQPRGQIYGVRNTRKLVRSHTIHSMNV